MNKNDKYCIFLDIDGTLLGNNPDAFRENVATVQKIRSLGHKVFISTGRATSFIPDELDIPNNFDGVISGAGALSKMGDTVLVESLMPFDVVKKYAEFAMKNQLPAVIEGTDKMYHFGYSSGVDTDGVSIIVGESWVKLDAENIEDILTADIPIEKLTVLSDVPKEFEDILGDDYIVMRFSQHTEVIQKNHGKGQAMLEVAELLDIPQKNTIAIGDSMNDYDMIKAAGMGIAMKNACDKLKSAADMIADDVDNAGVSKVLKEIFNLR